MIKTCRQCQQEFEITEEDLKFYEKVSPVFGEKKYVIPAPTLCPECRSQQRMSLRNEKMLYERKCSLCQKQIISIYSSEKPYPIYCQECFWGDSWNSLQYGQIYNFQKPFFQQFYSLMKMVPRLSIINKQTQNSDYSNYSFANKNCYLTFGNHYEEDCMYGRYATKNKNCLDYLGLYQSEQCYESMFSKNCYQCVSIYRCENSQNCLFSIDVKNCSHCLFCTHLRNKQYHIRNKPYSKKEYTEILQQYGLESYRGFSKSRQFYENELRTNMIVKSSYQMQCEKCEGDNLEHGKNAYHCFDGTNCEDVSYAEQIDESYSSMDMTCMGYDRSELCYQTIGCSGTFHCLFCDSCWHNNDLFYCSLCFNCKDCFGCIGLRYKQYCILNKQYTKEEYEKLVPKIIENMIKRGEWGEFFPPSLSPFGYNETVANEYYPLTREQVLAISDTSNPVGNRHAYSLQHGQIFNWSDYESPKPDVKKIIPSSKLPDDIKKIPDDILNWAIECEITKKPFRIIKQELEFYRQHNLPIPRRHPDQRHKDRLQLRNPRKLWTRQCMKCNKEIQTTYAPDRKEMVYCEECYLKEVY